MNRPFVACLMLLGLVSLIQIAAASAQNDTVESETSKRESQPRSKGVELYSTCHSQTKQWRFGLLPGTNALKSADQVNASFKIVGLKALKRELATLAENENVFLVDNDSPLKPRGVELALPSKKVLEGLRAFCEARKINFECLSLAKE